MNLLRRDLCSIAVSTFFKSAEKLPRSVTAQGLYDAQCCIDARLNPEDLSQALLQNPGEFEKLAEAAKKSHERHGIKHAPTPKRTEISAIGGFALAEIYIALPQDERNGLLDLYPSRISMYSSNEQNQRDDFEYRLVTLDKVLEKTPKNSTQFAMAKNTIALVEQQLKYLYLQQGPYNFH